MYPDAFINYLAHFHGDRDYFECHEILEEYWKEIDKGNRDSIWVGFIQLAVGCYHYRRQNIAGATKTLAKARSIFSGGEKALISLGIDEKKLLSRLDGLISRVKEEKEYTGFTIPIKDSKLEELCIQACRVKGAVWCDDSCHPPASIIDRHKIRDRSMVISERVEALERKKQNAGSD
ncbi:DUF309 domain-containing protein [Neobacillus piezotolerans]|uniref:DUF309 domain-containing protein n=1 Tax=Neobacillus piezotolerans TaxID=2259171 RepID=A0A3D8GKN1_9BACI|nr:DUF309 domain-containing protein [Neobacillus piezotolerans]RDU35010.1 DUF309 domain-containing protein [Neobacillus piezotolerans]